MKRLVLLTIVATLIFASCSIFGPVVVDHSDTVVYSDTTYTLYDFDEAGPSGFMFKTDGDGITISLTDTTSLEDLDLVFDNFHYNTPTIISPDMDEYLNAAYAYKTTYIALASEDDSTGPTDFDDVISEKAVDEGWYFLKIDDGRYVKMHITAIPADTSYIEFEYWIQQDTTEFFAEE